MEVIFIKDLKNQGKKGQIKNVKDGYGTNFLIKNGYAVLKNKENLAKLERDNAKKEELNLEKKKEATILKEKLDKVVLEFKVKTGKDDKVFGSVTPKQIKDSLKEQGYEVEKNQIENTSPAVLGFHNIDIDLYPGIKATIKVHLVK